MERFDAETEEPALIRGIGDNQFIFVIESGGVDMKECWIGSALCQDLEQVASSVIVKKLRGFESLQWQEFHFVGLPVFTERNDSARWLAVILFSFDLPVFRFDIALDLPRDFAPFAEWGGSQEGDGVLPCGLRGICLPGFDGMNKPEYPAKEGSEICSGRGG